MNYLTIKGDNEELEELADEFELVEITIVAGGQQKEVDLSEVMDFIEENNILTDEWEVENG